MRPNALIGYTGFVGSNLNRVGTFQALFNSSNYLEMIGSSFGSVVCAGVSADKWIANTDPETDARKIAAIVAVLSKIDAEELILISTIDVYPDASTGGDETLQIDLAGHHAYGRSRYELELWAQDHFPNVRVIRLPALFGPGLKKNVIYDLLHNHRLEHINPLGVFQWYPVTHLWKDMQIVREHDLRLVNLFPEPIAMQVIMERMFPNMDIGPAKTPAPCYAMKTRYGRCFGELEDYVLRADQCLTEMHAFVDAERITTP